LTADFLAGVALPDPAGFFFGAILVFELCFEIDYNLQIGATLYIKLISKIQFKLKSNELLVYLLRY